MNIFRNREIRGILCIVVVIFVLVLLLAGMSGKLDPWLPWFSGPRALDRIVFVSDRSGTPDIYSMNTDGSEQSQLTSGVNVDSVPSMSPFGNRIVFCAMAQGGGKIFRIGARGGTPDPIARGDSHAAYSPDGKKLAYMTSGRVVVADPNGDNSDPVLPTRQEVREAMANAISRDKVPAYTSYTWGPDSNSMAGVTRNPEGNDALVYLPKLGEDSVRIVSTAKDKDGNGVLIYLPKRDAQPMALAAVRGDQVVRVMNIAWAAKKAAFVACLAVGDNAVLVLFDAEQGTLKPLMSLKQTELMGLAVSPDASSMAMAIKPLAKKAISALATFDLKKLSIGGPGVPGLFTNLVYSPLGDKVLAVRVDEGKNTRNIVSLDLAGSELKQLTNDGHSISAIWSPVSAR